MYEIPFAYYSIAVFIIIQIIILILLFFSIFFREIWLRFKDKRVLKAKKNISAIMIDCIEGKKKFSPKLLQNYSKEELLPVMESFDHRFYGGEWLDLKREISEQFLLPSARKQIHSKSWENRSFAARVFALCPLLDDERLILSLQHDSVFLVSSVASIAVVRLELKGGIYQIIKNMAHYSGYSRFFLRDILLEGESKQVFQWIEEYASKEKDESIHLTCLNLLAGKSMPLTQSNVKNDLDSKDPKVRLAALKVYVHNPQKDSNEVISKFLDDPDEEMRCEAILGLEHFVTKQNLEQLKKALSDDSWKVRKQAALVLKSLGKPGIDILNEQDPRINKNAYEVAQHVLQFDW